MKNKNTCNALPIVSLLLSGGALALTGLHLIRHRLRRDKCENECPCVDCPSVRKNPPYIYDDEEDSCDDDCDAKDLFLEPLGDCDEDDEDEEEVMFHADESDCDFARNEPLDRNDTISLDGETGSPDQLYERYIKENEKSETETPDETESGTNE